MEKLFKRTLATIMVVLIVITSVPLSSFVGFDWSDFFVSAAVSPIVVEDTNYGILDPDVSAKKITLNSDFYFVSHQIDYENLSGNWSSIDQYGEGYAIVAEYGVSGCYLVGINGLVKSFASNEAPKLTLLEEYSQDFPYALYRVHNPDTQKYDVFNASTCEYFEYGLDEIIFGSETWQLRRSDYCKSLTVIKKDNKYGILNNEGVIIYTPAFDYINEYKNCMIGVVTKEYIDEYGGISYESSYAILSNDGSSSQTKLYKAYGYVGDSSEDLIVCAVSLDGEKSAMISVENLTVLTEYKYDNINMYNSNFSTDDFVKYEGHYYIIGRYKETYTNNGEQIVCNRQDIICDDGTIWSVCDKFYGIRSYCGAYKNMLKISVGTGYSYDRYGMRIWDITYYLITPDNNKIYFVTSEASSNANDPGYPNYKRWSTSMGFYGDLELFAYDVLSVGDSQNFFDYNGKIIAENVDSSSLELIGDYLIFCTYKNRETKYFIYNIATNEFIIEDFYMHERNSNVVCISETEDNEKFGLFNLTTGEFSGYVFERDPSYCFCDITEFSGGDRKLWEVYFRNGGDVTYYINDKFEKIDIGSNDFKVFGQNLLVERNKNRKIIDFDGNIISEFNSNGLDSDYHNYFYHEENCCDIYPIVDIETEKEGLINSDGRIILDTEFEIVGGTYNGLTYVEPQNGTYDGYSSVVDKNGNALIYGKYDNNCLKAPWIEKTYLNVGRSNFISLKYGGSLYIYDLSKCAGDYDTPDSSVITQDSLFGEYNSFLNNNYYLSISEIAEDDIINTLSKQGHSARVVSFAKSALNGGVGYVLTKMWEMLPFTASSESKLQEELALEYLDHLDADTVKDVVADISKINSLSEKIIKTPKNIEKLTESSKVNIAKIWKSDIFTESALYDFLTMIEKNEKTIKEFFKNTGRTISVIDFIVTYLTVCTIQEGIVQRMMQLIDNNTDLYKGLNRINYQQRSGVYFGLVLLYDFLSSESISLVSSLIKDESVLKVVTGKNASLVSIALKLGGKILAIAIDAPKLKDIEKATMAFANCNSLKKAISNYKNIIKNNYEQNGSIDIETLKADYSLLCSSYFKALLTGLECARSIAETDIEYENINQHYDEFSKRLIYRTYIKTCLLNARSNWEYTVQGNKAIVSKLNAAYPGSSGRVPVKELIELSSDNESCYTIDIPEKIDGYTVSGIGSGTFVGDNSISGVYVSENVDTIQNGAFEECNSLTSLLLNDSIKTIESEALKNCSSIHNINIPYNVTDISSSFFVSDNTSLKVNCSNENILSKFSESGNIEIQCDDVKLSKLEVISEPTVKSMKMQDEINTKGLKLRATYENGETETVTDGFECNISERINGINTVIVYYKNTTASFDVEILKSPCSYYIKYVDEKGNEILNSFIGNAISGESINIDIPEIEGYSPVSGEMVEKIGYKNDFTVRYKTTDKISINGAIVEVSDQKFSGNNITPDVSVCLGGKELVKNVDYTVSYYNNCNPGMADVVIFGIGDYEGIIADTFNIIDNHTHSYKAKITKVPTCTNTGTKTFTCSCGDTYTETIAKLGHKYDNACDKECNTCKATRSITHTYKATTTKATLSKNGKVINKCSVCGYSKTTTVYYPKTIKLSATSYIYNGKTKTPSVTVKDSKGNTLKKDTDYTVSYASGRKNTGKYAVTVTFKGKYSGKKTLYFNILPSKTSKITPTCGTTSIKASWSKVTGASGYKVELLNSKGKVVKSATTTKTTYTFKSLSKVTTYKVRVTAYKTIDSKKVYSTSYTTITTSTAPAKVTLSKVSAGSKSATPTWKKVSGASGYEVMYSTSSKFKNAKTATVKKGSSIKTTIKKLTKGKKYYFKVRAYKTVDGKKVYGAWSAVKSVKVK